MVAGVAFEVEQHRAGVPEDDVLIVEVSRKPVRGDCLECSPARCGGGKRQTSRERCDYGSGMSHTIEAAIVGPTGYGAGTY